MSWQRSFVGTLTLLGESSIEGTYTDSPDAAAFVDELARAVSREQRARVLAREATAILLDVNALGQLP